MKIGDLGIGLRVRRLAISGRLTGVAADPTDSNTLFFAAAGGVWKTTNGVEFRCSGSVAFS